MTTLRPIHDGPAFRDADARTGVAPGAQPSPSTTPADLIRAWPAERPLGVLYRAGDHVVSRRTLLVSPEKTHFVPAPRPGDPRAPSPLEQIERVWASTRRGRDATGQSTNPHEPLASGWLTALSYELGRWIEPSVGGTGRVGDRPLAALQRFDAALLFDHGTGQWSVAGNDGDHLPRFDGGPARRANHAEHARQAAGEPPRVHLAAPSDAAGHRYQSGVARAIEYIRAGDVFQVNLAHVLSGTFTGTRRQLAAALLESSGAWHGTYMELDHRRAILSLSPELFVDYRHEPRRAVMRPMKGTRPGTLDPGELARSPKDHAELAMIIDLVRNDLGRVAEFASVRVEDERAIEHHGGPDPARAVWQGVATIAATLRPGLGPIDLVGAAFPSGSVTGAPKVRAMQIIDELEDFTRGFYCGSIGVASDTGDLSLSVAIRTAIIEDDRVTFPVGAGIVADSAPRDEWLETLAKSSVLGA